MYIWRWYLNIDNTARLSNVELKAWTDLEGISLHNWELQVIKMLDRTYWRISNE